PHYLHSFPTRRSSDLELLTEVLVTGKPYEGNEIPVSIKRHNQIRLLYFNIQYKPFLDSQERIIGVIQISTEVTELVLARKKAERDRKSTRLNSSHVKI